MTEKLISLTWQPHAVQLENCDPALHPLPGGSSAIISMQCVQLYSNKIPACHVPISERIITMLFTSSIALGANHAALSKACAASRTRPIMSSGATG
jgi:hypothetical protein